MLWTIKPNRERSFKAYFGGNTDDHDKYSFVCTIEDYGNGLAFISAATGDRTIPARKELNEKLKQLGFTRVRWIRVVEKEL